MQIHEMKSGLETLAAIFGGKVVAHPEEGEARVYFPNRQYKDLEDFRVQLKQRGEKFQIVEYNQPLGYNYRCCRDKHAPDKGVAFHVKQGAIIH